MSLSLVLAEAGLFHRQALKKREAGGMFESMHIAACELKQDA